VRAPKRRSATSRSTVAESSRPAGWKTISSAVGVGDADPFVVEQHRKAAGTPARALEALTLSHSDDARTQSAATQTVRCGQGQGSAQSSAIVGIDPLPGEEIKRSVMTAAPRRAVCTLG